MRKTDLLLWPKDITRRCNGIKRKVLYKGRMEQRKSLIRKSFLTLKSTRWQNSALRVKNESLFM